MSRLDPFPLAVFLPEDFTKCIQYSLHGPMSDHSPVVLQSEASQDGAGAKPERLLLVYWY